MSAVDWHQYSDVTMWNRSHRTQTQTNQLSTMT